MPVCTGLRKSVGRPLRVALRSKPALTTVFPTAVFAPQIAAAARRLLLCDIMLMTRSGPPPLAGWTVNLRAEPVFFLKMRATCSTVLHVVPAPVPVPVPGSRPN